MAKATKKMILAPLADRVLIRCEEGKNDKTASGIIIPDSARKEDRQKGVVIAVGRGEFKNGQIVPMEVKVGDKVLFRANDWEKEEIEDEEYYLVKEESILAIIK